VTWKRVTSDLGPSHFTHIDSRVLSNISMLNDARQEKDLNWFSADCDFSAQEPQTLFVNAAL
jgi:hypothetical protein